MKESKKDRQILGSCWRTEKPVEHKCDGDSNWIAEEDKDLRKNQDHQDHMILRSVQSLEEY